MKNIFIILGICFFISCSTTSEQNNLTTSIEQDLYLKKAQSHLKKHIKTRVPSQFFQIDPNKDTVLVSNRGTLLFIPKNNFLDTLNRPIHSLIDIEFVEIHNLEEAIQSGLSTLTTKNEVLETAGMFFINVQNNMKNNILYKQPIEILTHSNVIIDNLEQFDGVWKGESLVWGNPKPLKKEMQKIPFDVLLNLLKPNAFLGSNPPKKLAPLKLLIQDPTRENTDCPILSIYRTLDNNHNALVNTWFCSLDFIVRLESIANSCSIMPFLIYLENTDKLLWQVDELVAIELEKENNPESINFRKFAAQKKTRLSNKSPVSPEALERITLITRRAMKLQKENNLNYPINLYVSNSGWVNLDALLPKEKTKGYTYIYDIVFSVSSVFRNTPKDLNIKAFVFFKERNSAVPLDYNPKEKLFSLKITGFPKESKYFILLKDDSEEYVGFIESSISSSTIKHAIKITTINEQLNYKVILSQYMTPSKRITLAKESNKTCCNNY
jgi:hypothetical protein